MKKFTTKETIILIIATTAIAVSGFVIWKVLSPTPKENNKSTTRKINTLSTDIDQGTLKRINSLSDYGQPTLDNIGKSDLFAN